MNKFALLAAGAMSLMFANQSNAEDVIRHLNEGSTFPIAKAVEVPASKSIVFLSGAVPTVIDDKAEKNTIAAYGDTKAQTETVFQSIDKSLKSMGLEMGDVIKMQVFLVGDPAKEGKMDFAGFMDGYTQFFGTEAQPNLPSRSVMEVAALANPAWLVEIEVTAVRK